MAAPSKSKRTSQSKSKKTQKSGQKVNTQMIAVALIFVLLFVSYVVIFSSPDNPSESKNMEFSLENEQENTRTGHVKGITYNLTEIDLKIMDASAGSEVVADTFENGTTLEAFGGLNCTFSDENGNGRLDAEDRFVVRNASRGDWVKLFLKGTDDVVAFYTF
ncbi:MAG: hypothetical protein JSW28_07505 [Thermoplasmata archaeon]|nr:MAG: hypothetical protein JSW28_07505 [Thermoplasmata archaeon]